MRREHLLVIAQSVAVIAILALAPMPDLAADLGSHGLLALAFAVCVAVLTAFSVWLPRGDSVDSTAPMAFAAATFVTPPLISVALAIAWVVGIAASRRPFGAWWFLEQASRRALLMAGTYVLLAPVVAHGADGGVGNLTLGSLDYLALGIGAVVFIALDILLEQAHTSLRLSIPYLSLVAGNIQLRGWMVVAEMSVAALTVLIYLTMGPYGLVIATGMLLVMRQSFALLLEMRASYTATVEVLARSLEAYDPRRRGHAERVARMAADAARRMGFQSKRLEDVTYAALFHDVGRLGVDEGAGEGERTSSEVLADVNLLSGALPILRILDSTGETSDSLAEQDLIGAYLVARLSDFDSVAAIGTEHELGLGDAIGVRLYADTRRTADRVLRQVERVAPEPPENDTPLADVVR